MGDTAAWNSALKPNQHNIVAKRSQRFCSPDEEMVVLARVGVFVVLVEVMQNVKH